MPEFMTEAFGEPTEKQGKLLSAKTRYIGYGGSKGGGKSWTVRSKATLLANKYHGIKILIIRKTIKDLKRNYIRPLQTIYSMLPDAEQPTFNVQDMIFTYPNTSIVEFGFCACDADADSYRGNEWDILMLDEATELNEYQYGTLVTCIRGVNSFPKRIYAMCNPGGVGHQNIKRLFITREYRRSENPRDYTFIQAHVWDNIPLMLADYGFSTAWKEYRRKNRGAKLDEKTIKKLMYFSDYVKSLDNLPETLREAYLEGNWDIFAGQYFSEFNEDVHVMSEAEIVAKLHKEGYEGEGLPRHWRRSAGLDHGLDRFAALWFATDEKGQTYCYRNYEATDVIISASAKIFKELSRHPDGTPENIEIVTAPFDFWSRERTDAKSRAELYYDNGIPLVKAGRERVAGWMNVKEYLKYESHKTDDNQLAIDKPPKMIFLDSCAWILKYLPLLQSDPKKPSDVATEPHEITHSPDALRGWCSIHQGGTYVPPPPPVYNFESEKPKSTGLGEVTEEYLTGGY